jgi:hypothetical protein
MFPSVSVTSMSTDGFITRFKLFDMIVTSTRHRMFATPNPDRQKRGKKVNDLVDRWQKGEREVYLVGGAFSVRRHLFVMISYILTKKRMSADASQNV